MISRFYKANKELVDRQYQVFKSKVNMTYAEMVAWKKNKCSRAASIKIDEVINRVTRLLKKPKTTWTQKDFNDSKKVVSYISRATKIQDSTIPAKRKWGCMKGKNFYALRNWAYDREKEKRKPRRNPKHIDNEYLTLLKNAIRNESRHDLVNALIYLNQGQICKDCGNDYTNCYCELCDDCKYRRCLCNLNLPPRWEAISTEGREIIKKEALKLAKETLNRDNFRKLQGLLHTKGERIY